MRLSYLFSEGWLEDSGMRDPFADDLGAKLWDYTVKKFESVCMGLAFAPVIDDTSDGEGKVYGLSISNMHFPHDECVDYSAIDTVADSGFTRDDGLNFHMHQPRPGVVNLMVVHGRCGESIFSADVSWVDAKAVIDRLADKLRVMADDKYRYCIEYVYSILGNAVRNMHRDASVERKEGRDSYTVTVTLNDYELPSNADWEHPSFEVWIDSKNIKGTSVPSGKAELMVNVQMSVDAHGRSIGSSFNMDLDLLSPFFGFKTLEKHIKNFLTQFPANVK